MASYTFCAVRDLKLYLHKHARSLPADAPLYFGTYFSSFSSCVSQMAVDSSNSEPD